MIHYSTLMWILSSYDNNVDLEGWRCQIPITHTANPLSLMVNMALSVCTYWFTHSYDVCACMLLSLTLNPCFLMLHHCPSASHGWWLCIIWELNIHSKLSKSIWRDWDVTQWEYISLLSDSDLLKEAPLDLTVFCRLLKDFSDFFFGQQVASGPVPP